MNSSFLRVQLIFCLQEVTYFYKKSYISSLLQAHELLKRKNLEKEESRFVHVAIVCQICFASFS